MYQLMFGSGLRVSEVAKLKVQDVNLYWEILTVKDAKGKKDRLYPDAI